MIKILGPEGKEKGGVRKFYLARVCGKLEGERKILVMMKWDGHAKVEKNFVLIFFAGSVYFFFFGKRSRVVEEEATRTVTLVQENGKYDVESDSTLVTVEITSGFRHQIRCKKSGEMMLLC